MLKIIAFFVMTSILSFLASQVTGLPFFLIFPLLSLAFYAIATKIGGIYTSRQNLSFIAFFFQGALLFKTLVFNLVGINFPLHIPMMGALGLYAVYGILFRFHYIWQYPVVRLLSGFALYSLGCYVFGHASDFYINTAGVGYPVEFEADLGDFDAKFIVMFTAVGVLLSYIAGLLMFSPQENPNPSLDFDKIVEKNLAWTAILLAVMGVAYILGFVLTLEDSGQGMYLTVFVTLLIAFRQWLPDLPNIQLGVFSSQKTLPFVYDALLPLILMTTPVVLNKSNLASMFLLLGVYFWWVYKFKLPFDLPKQLYQKITGGTAARVSIAVGLLLFVGVFFALGLNNVIEERLSYYIDGFTSASKGSGTLGVRIDNLRLLFGQWKDNINAWNFTFGNGLAASREAMFYNSAAMRFTFGRLVQTAHNTYIEFFYDYGLFSFLYFGAYFALLKQYWTTLKNTQVREHLRLLSASGLVLIAYVGIYGMTDGIKVPFQITQFGIHGFLSALLWYYNNQSLKKEI
ncbi:MAG: hypothetical protein ACK551_07885 [Vampirovibrionales bacterium]